MAILIRTLLILLALTGAVLTGCTPASTREALARADSIMAAAPDSALAILDALDPATLNSDEKMAATPCCAHRPPTRHIYPSTMTASSVSR